MEKVTLIIECSLLPHVDNTEVKDDIRKILETSSAYVDEVLTIVIRKEKG